MSKIVFKARFFNGNNKAVKSHIAANINYISKREHAESIYVGKKNEMMNENFESSPNISINPRYIKYISQRPGVNVTKEKSTLFGTGGCINAERQKEKCFNLLDRGGILWSTYISMKESDAHEMNLYSADDWKRFIDSNVPKIAKEMNIALNNFEWYAAFHNKKGQPHVHLDFYSINPSEGRSSKRKTSKSLNNIRLALIKDLYKEQLKNVYDSLHNSTKNIMQYLKKCKKISIGNVKKYGYLTQEDKKILENHFKKLYNSDKKLKKLVDKYVNFKKKSASYFLLEQDKLLKFIDKEYQKLFEPKKGDMTTHLNILLQDERRIAYKSNNYSQPFLKKLFFLRTWSGKYNYNNNLDSSFDIVRTKKRGIINRM